MVQSSHETKRNRGAIIISFLQKYRSWFPLGVFAAILLLGLLPMVSAPEVSVHVNVYQLEAGPMIRFLMPPVIILAIWAIDFFLHDFGRFTKYAITAAAAVQVVSIATLLHLASSGLTGLSMYPFTAFSAIIPTQVVGVGAWLLLGLSALFLIDCGLQLTKREAKPQAQQQQLIPQAAVPAMAAPVSPQPKEQSAPWL